MNKIVKASSKDYKNNRPYDPASVFHNHTCTGIMSCDRENDMSKLRLITVFLFAVFMVLGVTAQVHTQKGIVRKVTRSASDPFIPVQGVQVIVSGEANKASDKDGRFSLKVKVTDKAVVIH